MTASERFILEARDLTVRFGGLLAVDNVSLGMRPGVITGLIGPNGAGKTTLFNAVSGLQQPTSGQILFNGKDVSTLPPHKRARMGMARTFQRLELFLTLSVRDNVRVACDIFNAHRRRRHRIDVERETDRLIEFTGLQDVAHRDIAEIPTGRARVVELARALITSPSVLLLDEPAGGQTEEESRRFGRLLREVADGGTAICLVEHDLELVMSVCTEVHVLDFGKLLVSGTPEQIRQDQRVIDAYIGTVAGSA
jgi:branched-chain amino acid transport system ATP-binding protein